MLDIYRPYGTSLHWGVVLYSTNISPLPGLSRRLFAIANSVGRKQIKMSKKFRRDDIFFLTGQQ